MSIMRLSAIIGLMLNLIACRTTSESQVANSKVGTSQDQPVKSREFKGKSGQSDCSLKVEWNIFGITEISLRGGDLGRFALDATSASELKFIDNTKALSRWLRDSSYGQEQLGKGFLPEYRLSNKSHLFASGVTYEFKAGWYLNQPTAAAPASRTILQQSLELNGTVNVAKDEFNLKNFKLEQNVSEQLPLAFGKNSFACADLVLVQQ